MTSRAQVIARLQRSLGEVAKAIADLIVTELDPSLSPRPRGRPPNEATASQVAELLSVAQATLALVRRQTAQPPVSRTRDGDRMVSRREAARIIGVSPTTLWRMEKEGALVPLAMRGVTRYRESQLIAYMNTLPPHKGDQRRVGGGSQGAARASHPADGR